MINLRQLLIIAVAAASMISFALLPVAAAPPSGPASAAASTYRNAVSDAFSDTFADPSVIQGKDGWWYAFATADPLYEGQPSGAMHIARTKDWSHWDYRGTVFDDDNRPSYAEPDAGLWAPDIRYIDGRYVLYFTVTDTTLNDGGDPGVGVATADSPEGPWQPTDEPIIAPRERDDGSFLGTIDPAGFTDVDGQNYLYFGGYNGGFWGTKISSDGLTTESGDYTQVTATDRYEGGYVVRHDGWYYFMGSSANCCAGPATGYTVYTGRSRSPLGPFTDAEDRSLTDPYVGGTNLIRQNGNRWIGTGHHAIMTDAAGRDFIVYHAIDRKNPWLNQPFGVNRRPMLIDRIDWIDGWPRARAGAGPSVTAQPAPVTGSGLGITADDPAAGGLRGLRGGPQDPQAGATARLTGSARTVQQAAADSVLFTADLDSVTDRTSVRFGSTGNRVTVSVDPDRSELVVRVDTGDQTRIGRDRLVGALSDRTGWQRLTVRVEGRNVQAWLSESGLADPGAEVRLTADDLDLPIAPVQFTGAALIDNLTIRPVAAQATELVPTPERGALISSDEFTGDDLADWSWVRPEASSAEVTDGRLSWPVQDGDLSDPDNRGAVLLHKPLAEPDADWMVETRLDLDLGEDEVRNFQQAGLVAYRSDTDFARLDKVAIAGTRATEFGRLLVGSGDGRTAWGAAIEATPSRGSTWLRLAHHRNAAGEHQFRSAVSTDGEQWTWGAVWTFSDGTVPRIGLVTQGGSEPATTAAFDYVRFYSASWPG
ncbi:family 43 glycosylhydrolase [Microlunatus soli]|uniref:Glycosyl hydrolases family 43 n=1 Tax=Microlunatus soli TaxID=630515 RepID=A0A1H1MBL0_9ACTN|nr:family 43 glycosylhydrolase [Microlunatus soli]SDR83982.1 Glycosyl hydrolases family 43 [Microlunatus soli]